MDASELIPGFEPETELERRVTSEPELLEGLAWGEPRAGHPEGPVGTHVSHLLEALDHSGESGERREQLRFIAIVHDAFKSNVRDRLPRVGENHHAMRARRFAERFVEDENLLATIEMHDRPYALWRKMKRRGKADERGFRRMMKRIPDPEIFLRFIELDGSTEGKRPEPIEWFREELQRRGLLDKVAASGTFCLIHGKWHDSSGWDPLAERLQVAGHHVVNPDLPFEDPSTTHAQRIEPALQALGGAVDPVIVVGHSLGTAYAPLVVDALARTDVSLVYLCPAPVGPFAKAGAPMSSSHEGFQFPPNREDGTSVWDPDDAIAMLYPRLPDEVARRMASRLKPGASPADPYPLDGQPAVPTTFIYGAHDELFQPEWSRWVAREVAHVEPIELPTGHFPMLEAPDLLAETLTSG